MNILAPIIVLFVVICGFGTMWVLAANGSQHQTTTDSFGKTLTPQENITIKNGTALVGTGSSMGGWIAFVVLILILAMVFVWAIANGKKGGYRSRY